MNNYQSTYDLLTKGSVPPNTAGAEPITVLDSNGVLQIIWVIK